MDITFYNFNGELKTVNKVLTAPEVHTGHFKGNCDFIMPDIEFKFEQSLLGKNIAYIPVFNAYYLVTGRTISNNNIILSFELDHLFTYRNNIKGSYAHITRSNIGDLYIPDDKITNLASHNLVFRKLGEGFEEEHCYVLTVAGSYGGSV